MFNINFITSLVIVALWSSTSAEIFTVHGRWGAEMQKCGSGGEDYHMYNYNISSPVIKNLTYDSFNYDTFVKVGGIFELKSGFVDDITYKEWTLNEYDETNEVKYYNGQLRVAHSDGMLRSHVAFWNITLSIQPNSPVKLQTHVYAKSTASVYCAFAKADINTLTIAN